MALALLAGCAAGGDGERPPLVPVAVSRPIEVADPGQITVEGAVTQGGVAIGQAPPGTVSVTLDGKPVDLDPSRRFVVGFGREAAQEAVLVAVLGDGRQVRKTLNVQPRTFKVERIASLRRPAVADPEWARMRAAERERIGAAHAVQSQLANWRERFTWPVTGRISGVYGSQRILGDTPASPHYGVDVAVPAGTPVEAPAGGRVTLASPPAFSLEGNMVILDHGHGLFSVFLHLSKVDVKAGDVIRQGDPIGEVGRTGRATGPHLHWAMYWTDVRVDPQLLVGEMPPI